MKANTDYAEQIVEGYKLAKKIEDLLNQTLKATPIEARPFMWMACLRTVATTVDMLYPLAVAQAHLEMENVQTETTK